MKKWVNILSNNRLFVMISCFATVLNFYGFSGRDDKIGNVIGHFVVKQDTIEYEIYQVNDTSDIPMLYYADIDQYPCAEKICYKMHVRIYWDMWGHFLKVETQEDCPLTKIGHEPFNEKDYMRLHKLLNNPDSYIKFYELDKLNAVESENRYYSLDAITGATITNVKYESVRGAVKTCYSLWNIVNGEPSEQIKNRTLNQCKLLGINLDIQDTVAFIQRIGQEGNKVIQQSCLLEIQRREGGETKDYKALSNNIMNDDVNGLSVYNYLLQCGYNDKNIRQYQLPILKQ